MLKHKPRVRHQIVTLRLVEHQEQPARVLPPGPGPGLQLRYLLVVAQKVDLPSILAAEPIGVELKSVTVHEDQFD